MSQLQPCCETLTLVCLHARERERGQKEGGRERGEATDPGRKRKKDMTTCMLQLRPVHIPGVRRGPARHSTRRTRRGTQAGRQNKEGGEEEGEREERKKTPEPRKKNDPCEKTLRRSLSKNRPNHNTPTRKPSPEKTSQYTAEVLPTKPCKSASLRKGEL